jgi:hypothetical protein
MQDTWDFVEVEVKMLPDGRPERLVQLAQEAAPPGSRMVRKPHVAFFDLYFDTPSLALARNGAYLRARFSKSAFRKKGNYKLFYKDNAPPDPGARYLARREVRSDLRRKELLRFSTGRMPGAAADLAYDVIERAGEAPPLQAICVISSFRRYFTMRTTDPVHTDILNLGIEQSTALRARDIDLEMLIHTGFVDVPLTAPAYHFELAEAEMSVEGWEPADEMFRCLVASIEREFEIITGSKYITTLQQLGML